MSVFALKSGFLAIGLLTWLWGYRADNGALRWLGIAFLAAAFALRFAERGRRRRGEPPRDAD